MDLSVDFLGIKLKNPIIIASCPISESIDRIYNAYLDGAAAIILKTCTNEVEKNGSSRRCMLNEKGMWLTSSFSSEIMDIDKAIALYEEANNIVDIPLIPSITSKSKDFDIWLDMCKRFDKLGVIAIQLDFFYIKDIPLIKYENYVTDLILYLKERLNCILLPKINFNMVKEIIYNVFNRTNIKYVSLLDSIKMPTPLAIFNNGHTIKNVENNRYASLYGSWQYPITVNYTYDFYLNNFNVCAGGGINNYKNVLELLCYGANAVQIATYFLLEGTKKIKNMLDDIEHFLKENNYNSLSKFILSNRLFLNGKKKSIPAKITFDSNKCILCKKCIDQTFCDVFSIENNKIIINYKNCIGCSLCTYLCSTKALDIVKL